jgi:hypothetical protein
MEEVKDSLEMDRYVLKTFSNRLETKQCKEESHFTTTPLSPPSQGGDLEKYISTLPSNGGGLETHIATLSSKGGELGRGARKMGLIRGLARALAGMHNYSIFHHDLKTCNIMVKEKYKSLDFTFLDFDNVSFSEKITVRKRVKNLVQINLSTPRLFTLADRLRFLNEYMNLCGITNEKKNILRGVINLSKVEKILYVSSRGDVTENW